MAKTTMAALIVICIIILLNDRGSRAETLNLKSASISPSCASAGSSVTITANANTSSGVYFRHFVKDYSGSGVWTLIADWSTANTVIWSPETNGKKIVVTHITDDPTASSSPSSQTMFSYESGSSNCIDPVAINLAPTSVRVNEPVTITVTGARSGLYYQFWVLSGFGTPNFGNPIMLKYWSTENTCVWTPPSQDHYLIEVYASDDPSNAITDPANTYPINTGAVVITYQVDLPSLTGNPPQVLQPLSNPEEIPNDGNSSSTLTVKVTDPDADLVSVVIDLSPLGGSSSQAMYDNGTNGDVTAGDGIYSTQTTASPSTPVGERALLVIASDQAGNTGSNYIDLFIIQEITDTVQPQATNIHTITNDIEGQTLVISYSLVGSSAYQTKQAAGDIVAMEVKDPRGDTQAQVEMEFTENTITIPDAEAGTWTLEVTNQGNTESTYQIVTVAGGTGVIVGTVKDASTRQNLTGVTITTDIGGVTFSIEGHYVLVSAAGQCTVTASMEGYQSSSIPGTTVTAGEETTVDFTLTPEGETRPPCPATVALKGEEDNLFLLRRFRDEVLAEDAQGQEYTDLYYCHAPELTWLLLRDTELRSRAAQLLRRLLPQIRSLLDGEELSISYETMEEIESLLNKFEAHASPELQDTIERIKEDLLNGSTLELALGSKPLKQVSLGFSLRK